MPPPTATLPPWGSTGTLSSRTAATSAPSGSSCLPGAGEAVLGVFLGDARHLGRGIGSAAVALALAEFRTAHPELPVALRVRRTNARAIACYRRVGFTITGSGTKSLPSGETVPYYGMVLRPC